MSKRGLPSEVRMRHDAHYVEELSSSRPISIGRMISVEKIEPNPEQPRAEIGNLDELTSSIREKGVLEPLLVKPLSPRGRWMIIAGERRWRAACAAGLHEVPCIEMDVSEEDIAEIALVENMQRKDLTPWEEADGLASLCLRFGYTHEDVAKKVGKSRSTITEALSIANMPVELREECRNADINVKSILLQIVRQPDLDSMRRMLEEIKEGRLTRDEARTVSQTLNGPNEKAQSKARAMRPVYKYRSTDNNIRIEVRLPRNGNLDKSEVVKALREYLNELEKSLDF